jgi:pyridinium-3,5-biscarboxylic acid mononucleotide sulfurtransferase
MVEAPMVDGMTADPAFSTPRLTEGALVGWVRERGPALVALSGGVDSALVASIAYEALGNEAVAATISNAALASREVERAARVARSIGIRHRVLLAEPLDRPEYRRNGADRCYFCRVVESSALRAYGRDAGVQQYLDGIHRDDLSDDRPGIRAVNEAGFAHPLLVAGWTKADVRKSARARGLPNWDQPSDACLASRVARGEPIDREVLDRIEAAEGVLLERGFRRVRVRVRAGAARIEVDPAEVARLVAEPLAGEVSRRIAALGFSSVTIDPRGYRGGTAILPVLR